MTTNIYPNSLVNLVAEAVIRRGTATLDDIAQDFPGVSRKKLHAALANARYRKRLRVKVRGSKWHAPSVWEAVPQSASPLPAVKPQKPIEPVPSVFSLAERGPWPGQWPPLAPGRVVARLGPWIEQEATTP